MVEAEPGVVVVDIPTRLGVQGGCGLGPGFVILTTRFLVSVWIEHSCADTDGDPKLFMNA